MLSETAQDRYRKDSNQQSMVYEGFGPSTHCFIGSAADCRSTQLHLLLQWLSCLLSTLAVLLRDVPAAAASPYIVNRCCPELLQLSIGKYLQDVYCQCIRQQTCLCNTGLGQVPLCQMSSIVSTCYAALLAGEHIQDSHRQCITAAVRSIQHGL